ncbi:MAG: Nif3-like dinuclear metal center hexameric protein [Denitrovibrio sp.]|nr:MAG: Nif3-like dinuclear metal center hexameric protein [Denitrovibrio sp.]
MGRLIKVKDILDFLESGFADLTRQYDWDNSGRQLIIKDQKIKKTALALDPTEKVIEEAIKEGCELLITHHPLFFGKTKSIDSSKPFDAKVIKAIKANLSIVAAHTSLDLADYGLNDYICYILNAKNISSFVKEGRHDFVKIVVFVPRTHAEAIRVAMEKSGGGHIGNYSGCTFSIDGVGRFRPGVDTNPYIGTVGELEAVDEARIETIIDQRKAAKLIEAVVEAHPYEEVPYDIYKLDMGKEYGLGRVCGLEQPMSTPNFLQHIKDKLDADTLKINFELDKKVEKFAVVTGSGASMWKSCLRAGVNVLVTGDMKHHDAIDAKENGVMIVDAGHFETERIYMKFLADKISNEFNIETVLIEEDTSIIHWR